MMKTVEIYTDGSCRGNPGPGGWAVILLMPGTEHRKQLAGGFALTTNNRMEILAAIKGLETLKFPCNVHLFTDSQYLTNAVSKNWLYSWRKKNWIKADGKKVKNVDLWLRLVKMLEYHHVKISWLRSHAGHPENEKCDELARSQAERKDLPEDKVFMEMASNKENE